MRIVRLAAALISVLLTACGGSGAAGHEEKLARLIDQAARSGGGPVDLATATPFRWDVVFVQGAESSELEDGPTLEFYLDGELVARVTTFRAADLSCFGRLSGYSPDEMRFVVREEHYLSGPPYRLLVPAGDGADSSTIRRCVSGRIGTSRRDRPAQLRYEPRSPVRS